MKTLFSTFLPFRFSFPSFPSSFPLFSCLVSHPSLLVISLFRVPQRTNHLTVNPPSPHPSASTLSATISDTTTNFSRSSPFFVAYSSFTVGSLSQPNPFPSRPPHRRHLSQPNPFPSRPPSSSAALFRRFSEGPGSATRFSGRFVLLTPTRDEGVRSTKRPPAALPAPGPSGNEEQGGRREGEGLRF